MSDFTEEHKKALVWGGGSMGVVGLLSMAFSLGQVEGGYKQRLISLEEKSVNLEQRVNSGLSEISIRLRNIEIAVGAPERYHKKGTNFNSEAS